MAIPNFEFDAIAAFNQAAEAVDANKGEASMHDWTGFSQAASLQLIVKELSGIREALEKIANKS